MTLKNPALLKNGDGVDFLDYWFSKVGKGKGNKDNENGSFNIRVRLHASAVTEFPKSARGLCGVMNDFELGGSLYQVGLRDLAKYIQRHDEYLKINIGELPDVLARDWKKYTSEIVKLK